MIGRAAAVGAIVLAVVVLAVVLLGGGQTHTYSLVFQSAGQLVKDDDVQVGGRRSGSISSIEPTGTPPTSTWSPLTSWLALSKVA